MADTLEPIVIPPLKVDKHFTCAGSGLLYEDQERVSADSLRTLLLPSNGRNGISDRDRSKAWWGAQALFYGFKYTKTMTIAQVRVQLEAALRDKNNGLRVPQSILDMEYKHNKEFRELNAQVRDKAGMGTTKRKREADPVAPKTTKSKTAQVEPSSDAVPKKKARVKKADDVSVPAEVATKPRTKQTAKKSTPVAGGQQTTKPAEQPPMPLWDEDVKPAEAPKPRTKQTARKTTQPGDPMDVNVKSRTKQTAQKTVTVEDFDDLATARRSAPVPADAVASSSAMPAPPRTKQTARRGKPFPAPPARSSAPRTDAVSGHWRIVCPAISEEWDHVGDDFHMNIIGRGTTLQGEFELGIIHGLLRCDRVEQRGPNGAYAALHWAGREDHGPVCTPDARRSGYIKFTGDRLKGKFKGVPACGEDGVEFEGQWEAGASQINRTWDDYNEAAYECANRARWGGTGW